MDNNLIYVFQCKFLSVVCIRRHTGNKSCSRFNVSSVLTRSTDWTTEKMIWASRYFHAGVTGSSGGQAVCKANRLPQSVSKTATPV